VPASIVVNKQASRRECSQSWCRVHACCCIRLADVVRSKNVCKIPCLWYFQADTRVSNWGGVTKVHCTVQMHHAHTTGCQQGKAKRAQPAIVAIHTITTHTLTLRIKTAVQNIHNRTTGRSIHKTYSSHNGLRRGMPPHGQKLLFALHLHQTSLPASVTRRTRLCDLITTQNKPSPAQE
jgi:hypothetical protein